MSDQAMNPSELPIAPRVPVRMAAIMQAGAQIDVQYFVTQANQAQIRKGEHFAALRTHLESVHLHPVALVDNLGRHPLWAQLNNADRAQAGVLFMPAGSAPTREIQVAVFHHVSESQLGTRIAIERVSVTEYEIEQGDHRAIAEELVSDRGLCPLFVVDELHALWPVVCATHGVESGQRRQAPSIVELTEQAAASMRSLRAALDLDAIAEVPYAAGVSLVVRSLHHDARVEIASHGQGSATVIYREDGVTLEVAGEHGASVVTYAVGCDELTSAEDPAPNAGPQA